MKKNITKILIGVAAAIFISFAIVLTVLAVVKKDYNQVINKNMISTITAYKGANSNVYFSDGGPTNNAENKNTFNTIIDKYLKGTKESYLSTMFQGAFSKNAEPEVVKGDKKISNLAVDGKYTLMFEFNAEQTLKIDGVEYTDESKFTKDKTVKFTSAFLNIENNSSLTKITLYVGDGTVAYYGVRFVTHHSNLYSYLETLTYAE